MKNQKSVHISDVHITPSPFQPAVPAPIVEAMERRATILGRSISAFQHESMRFMTRRFEQNMKAVEQFGGCKSLPDLFAAQQHWLAEMASAYTEELARCGELVRELLNDGAAETDNEQGVKQNEPLNRSEHREH